MRLRLHVGDVFTIPIDQDRLALGQIVGKYGRHAYYLAVFDAEVASGAPQPVGPVAAGGRVVFLALALDAKFYVGDWVVVGKAPVRSDIPLPAYKEAVGTFDHIDVVDYSGEGRRRATASEAQVLPNRTIIAPVCLEDAVRARAGLEPWADEYARLIPDEDLTTARLFG